jgi:hypothetical protein
MSFKAFSQSWMRLDVTPQITNRDNENLYMKATCAPVYNWFTFVVVYVPLVLHSTLLVMRTILGNTISKL